MSANPTTGPVTRSLTRTVFVAFTAFGMLWGLYAAALPEIQQNTRASTGQLGTALLCVALAAAPAMYVVGRLLDRSGRLVMVGAAVLFAVVAPLPTLAGSVPVLVVTLLLFGLGSGAYDVVINSVAATVEAETGRRLMNRAHALFSVGLLIGSVGTGLVRAQGVPASVPLLAVSGLTVLGVLAVRGRLPQRLTRKPQESGGGRRRLDAVVVGFGALAALALLVESGVQQWSAVFLENEVGAPVGVSGLAPGVFAGSMALGRLSGHWVSSRVSDRAVLLLAGLVSGGGVLLVGTADTPLTALVGFAVAGAAISVAAPTIYGLAGRRAAADRRGATIGLTASIAYVGLLLGPWLVGQVASWTNLRTALSGLAVVSVAVSVAALFTPTGGRGPQGEEIRSSESGGERVGRVARTGNSGGGAPAL